MIFGQEIFRVLFMSQQMFEIVFILVVLYCSWCGIQQGRNNIKMTREGKLPAAEPSKDNMVFLYMD
jgi:hypothetical protein